MENGPVKKLALAAACFLIMASVCRAGDGGANPGTVVSNVYQNLEAHGCDPGFGFSPSGCNYGKVAPDYHRSHAGRLHRHEHRAALANQR